MILDEYSFCESVTATSMSPWCIRKLTKTGRYLSGGVDTPSLCGRVRIRLGWDLAVSIDDKNGQRILKTNGVCSKCRELYTKIHAYPLNTQRS